jgi:transposase InsO family protein
VKDVCETLEVSRSGAYIEPSSRQDGYNKADDEWLLPMIHEIMKKRSTYGYRRIHRLLNRILASKGITVNHKRVYRVMKQNGLLLPKHVGKRPERTHEGRIITLHSNTRWCSDAFEIPCWNGEKVRVAFSLDCCDRETMGYVATTGGITSSMICDLMLMSVEYRFGKVICTPKPIEWLTDNGSCYTAYESRRFAAELGLDACKTPISSPQSNGMAEAFVNTFKRDYVYTHDRPDAKTVLAMLPEWFEDYNENHPHKGLKMMSPREYIRNSKH